MIIVITIEGTNRSVTLRPLSRGIFILKLIMNKREVNQFR